MTSVLSIPTVPTQRNSYEEIGNAILNSVTTEKGKFGNIPIVAVRGKKDFANDSLDGWLERRFPTLFPHGRGAIVEPGRRKHMSFEHLVEHYMRTSTKQFQSPEFVLSVYDMIVRRAM